MSQKSVRIGCFSGFWGDSSLGAFQLVRHGQISYLVGDYLAEVTMAILARLKQGSSKGSRGMGEGGYVAEFVHDVFQPLMAEIVHKKIKVITNAGGMNPSALKKHIEMIAAKANISLTVASIDGDDIAENFTTLQEDKAIEKFSLEGEAEVLPSRPLLSSNAYFGAFPIAQALAAGADVVVTGRVVDSAIVLGPLIHEFGWTQSNYDLLGAGSVIGHLIECGCHATGGNFTDWRLSQANGWHNVGFPIAECYPDGTAIISKPPGTGGLVSVGTVSEQLVYEIHDPANYYLPDVIADFTTVKLEQLEPLNGSGRVKVSGAKGRPPTAYYKVSNTYFGNVRMVAMIMIGGIEARNKAAAVAEAIIQRTRDVFKERHLPDYVRVTYELLGSEASYGPLSRLQDSREVLLRLVFVHSQKKALESIVAKEITPSALSMAPGITGGGDGRPEARPELFYASCLVLKNRVPVNIQVGSQTSTWLDTTGLLNPTLAASIAPPAYKEPWGTKVQVPLIQLCLGRSGDKGDSANIGLICRDPKYVPLVASQVTAEKVKAYMAHILKGKVSRYFLPGINAFNFVCLRALDSGGTSSHRMDRQGKALAQMLLDLQVTVPKAMLPPVPAKL